MLELYVGLSASLKASLVIIGGLMIGLVIIGQKVKKLEYTDVPSGIVLIGVKFVELVNEMMSDFFKKYWKQFTPFIFTIFLYLIFANTASLWGLTAPMSNISVALSFSILAFGTIQLSALFVKNPIRRSKELMEPHPLFLPINLIGEISTPFAMGLRLFGNLLSGAIIGVIVYGLTSWVGILPGAFLLHPVFDIFFGIIQAYVYTILLTIFLSMAIED